MVPWATSTPTPKPVADDKRDVFATVKGLTGGLDGAVDSGSPAGVSKEDKKRAKKERKRKAEYERMRKGYLTPMDVKLDPIM